ncbi:MAG: serine/threonine-protein phosphatase, partial [Geminicoccaceae bacterium]
MAEAIRLRATAFCHVGAVREHNEDAIAVADWITGESTAAPRVIEQGLGAPILCLVADGMGGHAAGEVASRTVALH